ncbi:pimeloyl-ACP methyl ester carboxylesterase [Haloactinospora alba]|uniref:Pimeloyl-ACP methyl ester carboxylesterase n=1 Tax=Haloactinospora alba TaxID=405555 RepID=A0A543NIY9_9ACTN|nr:alpha/beta hydrolase [Haloactinospora alba]TQN31710.1 pimeloyl-ACP methyl ester carboxylesterase [Haloactinospora alba]
MDVPIVLVHGLRVSGSMWRPQVEALRSAGRRVAAPDLPGHGERRGEPFTLDGAVEAVCEAVDGLGGRALVVGLSLGGFVSILAAAAAPDRMAGLVAASCTARPAQALTHVYRIPTVLMDRLPDKGQAVNERFHRLMLRGDGADAVLDGGLAMEAARPVIDEIAEMDVLGALGSYPGPVWLINGARDHFRIHEKRFLDACVDGRLLNVPRAGHMVSLDQPENFTQIVSDAADVAAVREGASRRRLADPPAGRDG